MSDTKRSFPTLLVISLCVNAIALGIIGGTMISSKRHDGHEHADHQHRAIPDMVRYRMITPL